MAKKLITSLLAFFVLGVILFCNTAQAQTYQDIPIPSNNRGTGLTNTTSCYAVSSCVLSTVNAAIYSYGITTSSSGGYFMMFDATTAPSNGTVTPKKCWYVPANTSVTVAAAGSPPIQNASGVVLVFSTGASCTALVLSAPIALTGEVQQ